MTEENNKINIVKIHDISDYYRKFEKIRITEIEMFKEKWVGEKLKYEFPENLENETFYEVDDNYVYYNNGTLYTFDEKYKNMENGQVKKIVIFDIVSDKKNKFDNSKKLPNICLLKKCIKEYKEGFYEFLSASEPVYLNDLKKANIDMLLNDINKNIKEVEEDLKSKKEKIEDILKEAEGKLNNYKNELDDIKSKKDKQLDNEKEIREYLKLYKTKITLIRELDKIEDEKKQDEILGKIKKCKKAKEINKINEEINKYLSEANKKAEEERKKQEKEQKKQEEVKKEEKKEEPKEEKKEEVKEEKKEEEKKEEVKKEEPDQVPNQEQVVGANNNNVDLEISIFNKLYSTFTDNNKENKEDNKKITELLKSCHLKEEKEKEDTKNIEMKNKETKKEEKEREQQEVLNFKNILLTSTEITKEDINKVIECFDKGTENNKKEETKDNKKKNNSTEDIKKTDLYIIAKTRSEVEDNNKDNNRSPTEIAKEVAKKVLEDDNYKNNHNSLVIVGIEKLKDNSTTKLTIQNNKGKKDQPKIITLNIKGLNENNQNILFLLAGQYGILNAAKILNLEVPENDIKFNNNNEKVKENKDLKDKVLETVKIEEDKLNKLKEQYKPITEEINKKKGLNIGLH